jgi:hypothetical protein
MLKQGFKPDLVQLDATNKVFLFALVPSMVEPFLIFYIIFSWNELQEMPKGKYEFCFAFKMHFWYS